MFAKILSFILSILMFIPNLFLSGGVGSSVRDLINDNDVVSITKEYYYVDNVLYTRYVDQDGNEVKLAKPNDKNSDRTRSNSTLPETYDARNDNAVTSVKSQGSTGCCWAFSSCSMLESSLIRQGYQTKDNIDLSEAHLSWFTNRSYNANQLDNIGRDGLYVNSPFMAGGSWQVAGMALASWAGATNDSDYPFNASNTSQMEFAQSEKYKSNYHLTSMIDYSDADRDKIKQAVIDNGSVCTAYYHDYSSMKSSPLGYCYYQNSVTGSNHAVTIVGWNDNFPASYFSNTPSADGAWLIKNSWGVNSGTNGYFWLSYYETSITSYGVLTAKPAEEYDNNYQYDGFGALACIGYNQTSVYGGNVFTATGHQMIGGTGFTVYAPNTSCEISLYKDLTNNSNPMSGTLLEKKTKSFTYSGYYTLDFNNSYEINEGESFSIVVKYIVLSGYAYAPVEGKGSTDFYGDGSTVCNMYSETGQSYISYNEYSWTDTSEYGQNNVSIKAFTKNVPQKLTLNANSTVTLDDDNLIVGIYPSKILPSELTSMFSGNVQINDTALKTGTLVNLLDINNNIVDTATVVVFGDLDCNGVSDGQDAFIVTMICFGLISEDDIGKARMRAADYNNDSTVDETDFNYIFNAGLFIDSGEIQT